MYAWRMDAEVARTLAELEHKLLTLERTLHDMGHEALWSGAGGELGGRAVAEPGGQASTAAVRSSHPPYSPSAGRIVDEAIEQGRAEPPPPPAVTVPRAEPSQHANPSATQYATPSMQAPSEAELLRFRERLEPAAHELTREYEELLGRLSYAAVSPSPGPTISFARGAPSLDIIDVEGLRDASVRAFESDPGGTTAYGTAVGYPRLRSWIADHHGVEPEQVLVTNGSMQADAFLFEHLVQPGDRGIVERPTYDPTLLSLRQRGARLEAVALETDGIDTEALARLLSADASEPGPTLAHIIPNFQNPAGYTISLEKRRRLLALAAEHRFTIFEDDPYVALRFSGETLPT